MAGVVESGVLGLAEVMSHVSVLFGSLGEADKVEIEAASFPGWVTQEAVVPV